MQTASFILFAIIAGFLIIGYLLWQNRTALFDLRRWFSMRHTPLITVKTAKEGQLAKLEGVLRVSEDGLITAPISQKPCLCYRLWIEEYVKQESGYVWNTIIDTADWTSSFWLEDDTGQALVEVVMPTLLLRGEPIETTPALDQRDDDMERLLERFNESSQGPFGPRHLRYREAILTEGSPAVVLGRCHFEIDPNPKSGHVYRDSPTRLKIESPDQPSMVISNDTGIHSLLT